MEIEKVDCLSTGERQQVAFFGRELDLRLLVSVDGQVGNNQTGPRQMSTPNKKKKSIV